MITPACRRKLWQQIRTETRSYHRPSNAPKPTIDVKHIRQFPGLYEQNCIDRNYKQQARNSWRILDLSNQWGELQKSGRGLRERNNVLRRQISHAAAALERDEQGGAESKEAALSEARQLKKQLDELESKEEVINHEIDALALELPNLSSLHTPNGDTPKVLGYINDHPEPDPSQSDRVWRSHVHVGSELDLLDFSSAATTSGWGWYFLKNEAALLEQALVQYALSTALKQGWQIVSPPSIVYSHIAAACGFNPRDQNDEQQIYALAQADKDKAKPPLSLSGTAEIPFAGMKANTTFEQADLPLKIIGASRCYRAEAGARGVDTKGLYRVHEFTKVEMFAWTLPDRPAATETDEYFPTTDEDNDSESIAPSTAIFDEMLRLQKTILRSLGLHCRILEMPSTDMGASASRKVDIEAFFPSRRDKDQGWGEVSSVSICTDYQTRRLATRVRLQQQQSPNTKKLDFPHTVNGTALAVPRVLAAIMEAGWDEKSNSLLVPEVLRPWMGGLERVTRG